MDYTIKRQYANWPQEVSFSAYFVCLATQKKCVNHVNIKGLVLYCKLIRTKADYKQELRNFFGIFLHIRLLTALENWRRLPLRILIVSRAVSLHAELPAAVRSAVCHCRVPVLRVNDFAAT
ncbi:MAG: hypothetical protein HEQ38_20310 [Gemmatimonas sp.]|nr:hypothetical protein [Gemmatimonas sp.]